MTTKPQTPENTREELHLLKIALNEVNIPVVPGQSEVKNEGIDLTDFRISLDGMFISLPDANLPYESIFISWQEALYKFLLMPGSEFLNLQPEALTGEPDFLNVAWEKLFEIPVNPSAEQAVINVIAGQSVGVVSEKQSLNYGQDYIVIDQYKVLSVAQTLSTIGIQLTTPSIIIPVINPNYPSPNTPTFTADPDKVTAPGSSFPQLNELFLNTYQQIILEGHLVSGTFGFAVGASFGAGASAGPNPYTASFSASNIAGGTITYPVAGEIVYTTAQGNSLVLFTGTVTNNLTGSTVTNHAGDFLYILNNAILTPPQLLSTFGPFFGYLENYKYGITNNFNNTGVGDLLFQILDDKPVTHDQTNLTPISESDIPVVGTNNQPVTQLDQLAGSLITPITPSGILVISPSLVSSPTTPSDVVSNPSYFGANGGHVSSVTLNGVTGASPVTATIDNGSTFMNAADIAFLNSQGFTNSSVGDAALQVVDNLGNILKVDTLTGEYVYTLVQAFHHTDVNSPSPNVSTPNDPASVLFNFVFTDNEGQSTAGNILTLTINDDAPISANVNGGTIDEKDIQTVGSSASASPDELTGNILATGLGNIFGADLKPSGTNISINSIVFDQVSNATADGTNAITLQSSVSHVLTAAEVTKLGGGSTSDAATLITDSLGNTLLFDQVTGRWLFTLNNAVYHDSPNPSGTDAIESYKFNLIDSDGSVSNTSDLNISIIDDIPIAMTSSGIVNESGLGNGSQVSPTVITATGTLSSTFGADGYDATTPITFSLSTAGASDAGSAAAPTIVTNLASYGLSAADNGDQGVLTQDGQGNTLVIDLKNFDYAFVLNNELTHTHTKANPNDAVETWTYTLHDKDGSSATSSIAITINDDIPVAATGSGTVNESGLSNGSQVAPTATSATGTLADAFGADLYDATTPITFSLSTAGASNAGSAAAPTIVTNLASYGLSAADNGDQGVLTQDGQGNTLVIDLKNFDYAFVLNNELTHTHTKANPNDAVETWTYTLHDKDGSSATSSIAITINDDIPVAATGSGTVNESGLSNGSQVAPTATSATGTLADAFGADLYDATTPITFSLSTAGASDAGSAAAPTIVTNLASYGLSAADNGDQGVLTQDGKGNTLVIDLKNFDYAFVLNNELTHTHTKANPNDAVETWTYTLHDKDGSSATSSIAITINDDIPVAATGSGTVNESGLSNGSQVAPTATSATGTLADAFGADLYDATTPITFSLSTAGASDAGSAAAPTIVTNLASYGLSAADNGDQGVLTQDGKGNTLVIDLKNFDYAFVLNNELTHTHTKANPNDAVETWTYTLHDKDGSSATSSIAITINDDVPIAYDKTNAVNETDYYVQHNLNSSFLETTTGNLITDGTQDIFGADGKGIIYGIVVNNTLVQDGGPGDLDPTAGSILVDTNYGTFKVDTQGVGIGNYTYTMDVSKVQPLDGDTLHTQIDKFGYFIQDSDGSVSTTNVLDPNIGYANKIAVTIDLNETPVANADPLSTDEDTAKNFTGTFLLSNDTDPDAGDTKAIDSVDSTSTKGASITDNGGGNYTYDPLQVFDYLAVGESTTDTFKYTMKDAEGLTSQATVTVTITGVNDTPVVATTDVTGAVTELLTPVGNLTDSGTIGFTDVDLTDTHSISKIVDTTSGGALGSLIASVSTDTTGTGLGGVITWNYSVAASAVEYLAAGATKVETFDITLNDGNGGTVVRTISVTITGTNDPPAGADNTVTTLEDNPYTFTANDFKFSDPVDTPADSFYAVKITTIPGVGSLTDNGNAVSAGDFIPIADITAGLLVFAPVANANGTGYASFTFQDQDSGGTANGGSDLDPTARTMTINVTSVNDAPAGTDNTVTTLEDTPYVFATSDFGFTDPNDSPANNLKAVEITTLPGAGSLTDNGNLVSAGDFISVADITGGLLKFSPAANANGSGYASFTFQVQDDGGTSNGGVNLDQSPNTMTINVTSVNDAPAGADKTVTTLEDTAYVFAKADFGFTDPNDSPANNLLAVKITTLPGAGSLTDNGNLVSAGDFISVADITGGLLKFSPAANANGSGYASFTFQVEDDGGTANGGVDLDQSPNKMTINVTSVNDAPAGADNTVTTLEDTAYVFAKADFGFTDPNDSPANNLLAVKITTIPLVGSFTDNGVGVSSGQFISLADITGGLLKFTPAANANGSGYASFTFQVQDDGGTANGGVDLAQSANKMTIDVTSVNDAPAGADKTVTTLEDTAYTFSTSDFGFTDPNDSPANNLKAVEITTLPGAGSLTDNGVGVIAGQFIPVADITSGLLQFAPAANANGSGYASFTFQVQDDGGTANGGVDLAQSANKMTIDVTSVNDAPAGADKTVTTLEDTAYTFSTSDFGFTDPNDSPANNLKAVEITTLPGAGSLTDNGVGVIAGQFIPVADITSGLLQFAPAANANGSGYASFTFQVEDDGGTSNGGVNLDQSPNKMTINVTSVNDAPAGTDNTVTTLEDTAYVFAKADFGFTDPNDSPANNLLAVKISTIPLVGSFTDNGVGVIAGQFISLADITGGLLKFTPVANANGSGYASFTFQVEDDGGTANGGVNLDQSPNTMTINVTSVNDAPAGADKTVTTLEDTPYVFATSDFGFTDPNDSPANSLLAVKITALPLAGSLIDNSIAVIAGQFISVADITSGLLQFTPAANANGTGYASFTFQVEDNGGTANGGVDLDQSANKMTINVTSVNDAPAGTDNTVTTLEDTAYVFAKADFGFTDLNDSPANNLLAVKITTLPGAGSLTDNGVAVTTGQFISLSDITNSLLKFTPAANANGTGYASFTFQVEDDGGTLNGGVNLDQSANSMTINVTPVNDAPVLSGSNDPSFDHKTPAAVVADNAITITDIDSVNMSSATITITNAKSGDFLTYSGVLPGGITISGNNTTAITLSTNSSLANYDSVLKAITFNSTFNGAGPNRDINWTVTDDGSATSNTLTTHITITPVVLDLTGDGIHLVSASASHVTLGDVTGTTILNPIGWITSGEGVLMLDSNGNGTLTQFNQISFASYVPDAKTDLQGLVAFDTNHDGFLDAGDAQYNQFGVLLANGKFESLSQLGINNISLHSDNQAQLVNDNVVFGSSSYQGANGKSYQVADVGFTVGQVNKGVALQTSDVLLNPNHLDFNNLADNKSPDSSSAASHSPVSVAVDAPTAPIQAPQLPATVAGLSAPVSTETSPQTSSHSALSLVEIAHIQAQITMEHIEH